MAGKKNSRTSKTDHVLSLLAGAGVDREGAASVPADKEGASPVLANREAPVTEQKPEATAAPAQPAAPGRHLAPPILEVARLHNEALSETIREALTQTLEQELDQAAQEASSIPPATEEGTAKETPAPEENADEQQLPEPEVVPTLKEVPEETSMGEDRPAAEKTPVPEKTPAPEAPAVPASGPGKVLPDGSVFLNVMEYLVEERLEKYVKLFGLCNCQRCLADVRALALSRLPAKYMVLPSSSVTPMLSLYQAKFDSMVIAEVIQACKTVMESPRHTL